MTCPVNFYRICLASARLAEEGTKRNKNTDSAVLQKLIDS